ncbi:MAG: 4-aminobutyrate aminotransferase [Enterovirga sp.]|jgi:hypothetical protein|nr:4-aminobutyrate aminotransferase [Enterovirga sp.]
MRSAFAIPLLAASIGLALPAAAQTGVFRSASVEKGKVVRLAVVTALKKDCSKGEVGSVRVITAPKNGQLAVRSATLKTPASFRCPNAETAAQQLFYQSKPSFTGADEVSYETKTPDGTTETFTVKITVTDKPDAKPKGGLLEL